MFKVAVPVDVDGVAGYFVYERVIDPYGKTINFRRVGKIKGNEGSLTAAFGHDVLILPDTFKW